MLATKNNSSISSTVFSQGGAETDWVSYQTKVTGTALDILHPSSTSTSLTIVPNNTPVIGEKLAVRYDATGCSSFDVPSIPTSVIGSDINLTNSVLVNGQVVSLQSIKFNTDGTKMYVLNYTNSDAVDAVFQYTLTTPWDITRATYDNKSFIVGGQATTSLGLYFSPDGTKMYILNNSGNNSSAVYQYTLSVAWDVSTASYANKTFVVGNQATTPYGLYFSPDGTKMFVLNNSTSSSSVYQYTLSTSWDVSTATYASKSYSVGAQASTNALELFFSADGTKMYVLNYTSVDANDSIYQYTLSTAWDVSTASYASKLIIIGSQAPQPLTFCLSTDGTKLYASNSGAIIYQYLLTTAWDIGTGVFATGKSTIGSQVSSPQSLFFSVDGTKMYVAAANYVYQYSLSTAWDVNTATYNKSYYNAYDNRVIWFNNSGTRMYTFISTSCIQFNLSTAWDIGTASPAGKTYSFSTQASTITGAYFNTTGTKVYVHNNVTTDYIYQYTLSTAWDISTTTYDNKSYATNTQDASPWGIWFNNTGTRLYMLGTTNDVVYQYTLSIAWDISTASYASKSFSVTSQASNPYGLFFNNSGTRMYVMNSAATASAVIQYNCDINDKYTFNISSLGLSSAPLGCYEELPVNAYTTISTSSTACYSENIDTTGVGEYSGQNLTFYAASGSVVNNQTLVLSQNSPSGITYDSKNSQINSGVTVQSVSNLYGICFSDDGTKMYLAYSYTSTQAVRQYTLSTAWDISTLSYSNKSLSVSTQIASGDVAGICFSSDGGKMYVGNASGSLYQYTLSVPWDVSSGTYANKSVTTTSAMGVFFNITGTKLYILNASSGSIVQYTLSTAWDISTAVNSGKFLSVTSQTSNPYGLYFNKTGTKVYIGGGTTRIFYRYTLSTAWDISTATFTSSHSLSAQVLTRLTGIYLNNTGTKLYGFDFNSSTADTSKIFQYSIPSSTIERTIASLTESPSGTFATTIDSVVSGGFDYVSVKPNFNLASTENFQFSAPSNLIQTSYETAKTGRYAAMKLVGSVGAEVSSVELLLKKA